MPPHRIPAQPGEWIDRTLPITFKFEGRSYKGYAGDTLSSALWGSGVRLLGRSFKYHRPRGVMSMAAHDANVFVEDSPHVKNRRNNLRGDVLPITANLDVVACNTKGGVANDWLRVNQLFAKMLPVGFYYKAFHKPGKLFPFFERSMRGVAGLGHIDPDIEAVNTPKRYDDCDVLVIGAGASGLSAGVAAARAGAHVVLVDDQPHPGGALGYQSPLHPIARDRLRELLAQAGQLDNLDIRQGTMAAGAYGDLWVALVDNDKLTKMRARALIVAGGAFEQPSVFHNNDLPGVMLASAAQRLMHLYGVKPFERCVVLAANSDGYQAAVDLRAAGVDVAAIADLRSGGEPTDLAYRAIDAGIAVHRGHCVYEVRPPRVGFGVAGVVLRKLSNDNRPIPDTNVLIDCDGVAMSVGWAPNGGILYQAGARFIYDDQSEQLVPGTLPQGVFAAGRVNGVYDIDDKITDGTRAGQLAAQHLDLSTESLPAAPPRAVARSHPYPIYENDRHKCFIDFDEDVQLVDIANAHQEGYDNIELLKRYTTFGMGPSQGKLSNMNAVRALAKLNGAGINETGTTTSRPFHQPVLISHLAGRRFHPMRRTPMHAWHHAHHARFMHAGTWYRPEYYAQSGKTREDCIITEAKRVRSGVGMIDVSTLGKLEVSGPDARTFIEQIYTGKFGKLDVGRTRYVVACDESGIVIDDGMIARLGEDRYYLTATSSGVAAFYREMQRWAILWSMNITLANATGHLAALNIAGPDSRKVVTQVTNVDISADAIPYMHVREGDVAGAPARVMRVGFVGELGFEVHVPASFGLRVWKALVEAGHVYSMGPFGVEAQRLLRLEKGHIILSQDTDALTYPDEAGVAWAIGKDKAFFVGQRSIDVLRKHDATRRLVGFRIDEHYRGTLPQENHLIIRQGKITGRVTSVAHRSTFGFPLGMAYIAPDQAKPGSHVQIRISDGALVPATVTALPFYDPQNERQKM